jgi:hypothetical protein
MYELRIPVEEGTRLTLVEMASNVSLAGWEETDVGLRLRDGQADNLTIEDTNEGPRVSARVACEVRVPAATSVTVREVKGNLTVKEVETELTVEQVRGNLQVNDTSGAVIAEVYGNLQAKETGHLRLVGTVYGDAVLKDVEKADLQNVRGNLQARDIAWLRASRVGGNLVAKDVSGPLDGDRVGGNALLKGVAGMVDLDQVAGNLVAKNLANGARVDRIGGNLVLSGDLGTGCTYQLRADGNATLRFSDDTSAHMTLGAKGKLIPSVAMAVQEQQDKRLVGTLGQGGTEIVVEAKGNITVGGGQPGVAADLGEEIARQVEEGLGTIDLDAIGRQVGEEMEAAISRLQVKLDGVDWERLGHQAQQGVERALTRIQREVDRMADKAERQQAPGRVSDAEARSMEATNSPADPGPDLDEERLSILRMVEQGTISPQEAEMLLDALS